MLFQWHIQGVMLERLGIVGLFGNFVPGAYFLGSLSKFINAFA